MNLWLILAITCALLLLICKLSNKAMYIFKFICLYILFGVIGSIIIIICLPRGRSIKNGIQSSKIMKILSYLFGISWTVEGVEHLKLDSGCVVLMNHQSSLDVLAMLEIWPHLETGAAIIKKSLIYTPFFGPAAWLIGSIFVDRGGKGGRERVKKAGEEAKKNKTKLFMYPEGTRNTGKNLTLLPFKKGGFHVALDGKLPILPVVVSEYEFLDARQMIFNTGKATIRALPPIDTSKYSKETIDDLIELTRNQMLEVVKDLATKQKSE